MVLFSLRFIAYQRWLLLKRYYHVHLTYLCLLFYTSSLTVRERSSPCPLRSKRVDKECLRTLGKTADHGNEGVLRDHELEPKNTWYSHLCAQPGGRLWAVWLEPPGGFVERRTGLPRSQDTWWPRNSMSPFSNFTALYASWRTLESSVWTQYPYLNETFKVLNRSTEGKARWIPVSKSYTT